MVIKAQPRFNAMKPVSDPTAYNPALARRTGDAIADVGVGVATLGNTLAQVVKGTRDLERQAAIKNAVNYIEEETQNYLQSGVLSDEEIENGANPYELLKQKIESMKASYLEANPAYARDVAPYIDAKLNEKTSPFATELAKRHYNLAKERVRQTYINTENMIRNDPSLLDNTLASLPLELKSMVDNGTITENVYEKNLNERSAAFIKAAAESLADRGNDGKALEILRSKGTSLSEKETTDLETDIRKRATYFRDMTRDTLSIEKALLDKKNVEDEETINRAALNAQLSGDFVKATQIEAAVAQLTAEGKVSTKVFGIINKQERFEYQALDPKSEYILANMVSQGSNPNDVRTKVNSLVSSGQLSAKSAIKWLDSVKNMETAQKDTYFAEGKAVINLIFGDEKIIGDVFKEAQDPQRRLKVQAMTEYINIIADPKFTGTAMEAADMVVAKYKGKVPVVPLLPADKQVGEADIDNNIIYKYMKTREEDGNHQKYLDSLKLFNERKNYEKRRDRINNGAQLLEEAAAKDEEYNGVFPYQDAESKAKAQAEMMGR